MIMKDSITQEKRPLDIPQADGDVQGRLITALLDPRRYPHPVKRVRVVETHISWVLLAGRYAYKIKKSVDLGFLDFTDLSSRRHYCEEELRLNQRLAPQLYLNVISLGGTAEMPEIGVEPAIEYAVKMRRFAASQQLDRLAERGRILPEHMDSLASTIAHFHNGLPSAEPAAGLGSAAATHAAVLQTFKQLQAALTGTENEARVTELRQAIETEYGVRKEHLEQRLAKGFVRECHGDLHLGNIALIRGQPIPFDCIEFSPSLRWIDVMNEVAFTVMDLLHRQRSELAYRFLNAYLEATGDYGGLPLLRFYLAYRAAVRAMVGAIRAGQANLSKLDKAAALTSCSSFLDLATACLAQRHPFLVITHGLPGSGKTTFAQAALERLQAVRIRSDVERKRLFGLAALADSRSHTGGIYHAGATARTYERLHDLARELLAAGFPVIVDAAFLKREEREHFRMLANKLSVTFAIASPKAAPATMQSRIVKRQSESSDASEADLGVLKLLQEKEEVLAPQEQAYAVEFVNEKEGFGGEDGAWKKLEQLLYRR
jgi:aminoglycoside phosphotransferase family enzyme/predicted kinase